MSGDSPIRWSVAIGALPLAAMALALAPHSAATAQTTLSNVSILRGACSKLVVTKYDFTRGCSPTLTNQVYRNGRTSFTFELRTGVTVTFTGIATQVMPDANSAIQPIDRVIWRMAPDAPPVTTVVVGRCTYENPYRGAALVVCDATGADGAYSAKFRTDGSAPSVRTF